jgi:hypothetical protein
MLDVNDWLIDEPLLCLPPVHHGIVPAVLAFALWLPASTRAAPPSAGKGADTEPKAAESESRQKRDESIKVMHERAAQTKVEVASGDELRTAELNPKPLLYFTNEPHRIVGGSFWGWAVGGRPVALCKVEQYDRGRPDQEWLYCMTSLSEERIHVEWRDGESWSAKTAGVDVRDFPDAPTAADDERRRLVQMKDLSRRFAAMDFQPDGPGTTEFRLLTQPVWRYSSTEQGIVDGAVFVTAGAGAVYMIELHQGQEKKRKWRYAVTAMSAWAVSIKLDDQEIWKKPFTAGPVPYDNWIFRWELPPPAGK